MKKNFSYIIVPFLLLTVFSCSNDFLNDNIEQEDILAGDSEIIISPLWDADDYQFICANAGNADFTVENAPEWLEVETKTGKFTVMQTDYIELYQQSVGTIHCKAKLNPEFEKTGIYLDKIQISVDGKTCYVPVMYVSEGNPKINVSSTFTISYNSYNSFLTIQNTGEGILLWNIISIPEWLMVDMNNFNFSSAIIPQGNTYNLPLIFNSNTTLTGNLTGSIVLKTNDKDKPEVTISVTADLGSPEISLWLNNNQIDFGATATTYSLDIDAWGSGLLVWHFEELPEWLTITPSNGAYHTHTYYEDIIFTCDRTKLQAGLNSSVIYLKSNAYNNPSIAITVTARAPGNNANICAVEGNIVDAAFDKKTNTLYYAASQPNKLIVYDVTARAVLHEIVLNKAPTCLAVSEDFTRAAVGHSGQISAVDLRNNTVSIIDINGILYDIAFGEGDWFCYTLNVSGWSATRWVNITTSEIYTVNDSRSLYDGSTIKKVPTQPYIVATMRGYSPSGFYTLDVSNKTLKSYSHMDLSDFWFSEDGKYIFSLHGEIYRTSSATSSNDAFDADINSIGQLQIATGYFMPTEVEHSISTHKVWAIGYSNSESPSIYQFNDYDFAFQKSYFYSDVYQPDAQTAAFEVQAQYLFANSSGTELSVLRKGVNNNNWSIEFIQVTD